MARRLTDWLEEFLKFVEPESETPTQMLRWTGLSILGAASQRNISMPPWMLAGNYRLYPNLYVILVAEPGVARKSTTLAKAEAVASAIDALTLAATSSSDASLLVQLETAKNQAVYVIASEFSSFMRVSRDDMYGALVDLFDNRTEYVHATIGRGTQVIESPSVNLLAATTPNWVASEMPRHAREGGFTSRCLMVYEQKPREFKILTKETEKDLSKINALKRRNERYMENLVHDIGHIANNVSGEFSFEDEEVRQAVISWYEAYAPQMLQVGGPTKNFLARKHIHVFKVAMLLSLSSSDDLVISLRDFNEAREMVDRVEKRLPYLLSAIGNNPLSGSMRQIASLIAKSNGTLRESDIFARFYGQLKASEIDEALMGLRRAQVVEQKAKPNSTERFYKAADDTNLQLFLDSSE
ncbi:MAG: DUF3987 domain-containing protein [bacterium]|nr:DUF3987 domain-containing protein [bacterium]